MTIHRQTTPSVARLRSGGRHALRLPLQIALVLASSVVCSPAEELTLPEYMDQLESALSNLTAEVNENKTSYGGRDPDDWLDTCKDWERSGVLKPDDDSTNQEEEALKKRLRILWVEVGRIGYEHYASQAQIEEALVSFLVEANSASIKAPEWEKSFSAFAKAAKAGKKLNSTFNRANAAFDGVRDLRLYIEIYVDEKHHPDSLGKRLDRAAGIWEKMDEDLKGLPGVKQLIIEQKEELKKIKTEFLEAHLNLMDISGDCLGDTPPIFSRSGLAETQFDRVRDYLKKKVAEDATN